MFHHIFPQSHRSFYFYSIRLRYLPYLFFVVLTKNIPILNFNNQNIPSFSSILPIQPLFNLHENQKIQKSQNRHQHQHQKSFGKKSEERKNSVTERLYWLNS